MQVSVKYFASLRELMGESSVFIDIDKESSIDDVWQHVTKNKKIELDNVMATVNMEYVKPSYVIRDGDEIAFFPPVTGG
jgi:molybdopterin synthase sulfur carrier subunit|tara:strand:- start:493 stop:729 length:237 start_codon:yes stop_codon:yes gene_type:complete